MNIEESLYNLSTDWKIYRSLGTARWQNLSIKLNELKNEGIIIFPPTELTFNAFNHFDQKDLKVVLLGQDCYHGPEQATGLCFAVHNGTKIPPSLRNIIKECRSQCGTENVFSTDLVHWAKQGILLLNCALTVRQSGPGSHLAIWRPFIEELLQNLLLINMILKHKYFNLQYLA